MQPTYEKQSKMKLIASLVAVIVIAGVIILADHLKSENTGTTAMSTTATTAPADSGTVTTTQPVSSGSTQAATSGSSSYKDGTYTASSEYYVPHGYEDIKVSVTLQNGVITASSVTNSESNHDSARFEQNFAAAYKRVIIGKSIIGLQLNTVSGASDTTQGFNDALAKIAAQAKA